MYLFNIRRRHIPGGTITRKSIADAAVTLPKTSYAYTGEAISPLPTVRLGDTLLAVNEDYTVSYSDNTDIGMATVTVAGTGNYYGTAAATFYITAAPAGWADFDLSKLGTAVGSASLKDSGAVYEPGQNISLYGIQVLPNNSIFFAAQAQGHPYIWGFDDDHAFEVSHFKSTYDSRGGVTVSYKGAVLGDGGNLVYDTDSSNVYKNVLSAAYVLNGVVSHSSIGNAGLLGTIPYRMQFSQDGTKFFYKAEEGKSLFYTTLSTPWNVSSKGETNTFDLTSVSNLPTAIRAVYAFQFSPDGKVLLFTCESTGLYQVDRIQYLIKLSLSTAYDLSTATVHSYKRLSTGGNRWQGVAVNNTGTKMLLFKWNDTSTREFQEYNLTT